MSTLGFMANTVPRVFQGCSQDKIMELLVQRTPQSATVVHSREKRDIVERRQYVFNSLDMFLYLNISVNGHCHLL